MTTTNFASLQAKFLLETEFDLNQGLESNLDPRAEYEQTLQRLAGSEATQASFEPASACFLCGSDPNDGNDLWSSVDASQGTILAQVQG